MYHSGDDTWKNRPKYISKDVIRQVALFLKQGIEDLGLDVLTIELHGGEPLMLKKADFNWMCHYFRQELGQIVELDIIIQTNAILLDNGWIEIFCQHRIDVGVSVDGPKIIHDKHRLDKRGRGTYDRVVEKLKLLRENAEYKKISTVGILGVINPEHSAQEIYYHFTRELGVTHFDLLLPHYNYKNPPPFKKGQLAKFLCELFDAWTGDDNPKINIRFFASLLRMLRGLNSCVYGLGTLREDSNHLVSIASNGDLSPTDELRATDNRISFFGDTVFNKTLKSFLENPVFTELRSALSELPKQCKSCCWQNICHGGFIVHRYSQETGFHNPSIYCEDLKEIYAHIVGYAVNNGYPLDRIMNNLDVN